ncbi:hypothetical protein [Kitasatospora sp. McL0602]|uniref:hypothetical protein n=1 Tax=Kitasatospora sp. McL0602 TaxID=3439530 RepID=UPI003F8C2A1B
MEPRERLPGASGFAYPLGQYGLTSDGQPTGQVFDDYYDWARTTHSKTKETWPPADPYQLRAVSAVSTFSGGYAPTLLTTAGTGDIDRAVAEATWLILTFHNVVPDATRLTSTGQIKVSDLTGIAAKVAASGARVLTIGEALRTYN